VSQAAGLHCNFEVGLNYKDVDDPATVMVSTRRPGEGGGLCGQGAKGSRIRGGRRGE
jgi:hypothetical protein